MKETAAVAIVGGGIIGCSVAYHLAERGVQDIIVFEKETFLGQGSTAKAAGGIRQQFSTEVNIRMSMASVKAFEHFAGEMECEAAFHQVGYLFLYTTPEQWDLARRNVELQHRLGLGVEMLTPQQVLALVPQINPDGVIGATFCPTDGIADPYEFLQGYAEQARRRGVRIETEREVTGLDVREGKVAGIHTTRGDCSVPLLILAAGAYTGVLGQAIGLDIPIQPIKRQVATTKPVPWMTDTFPMVVDMGTGLYMHRESGGLLMGIAKKDESPGFRFDVEEEFVAHIVECAIMRLPPVEQAELLASWAGLYEVTPDHHPIIGWVPGLEGLIIAAGFSGHGFMHAPVTGRLVSELVIDRKTSIDITPLRLERFREQAARAEVMVI